MSFSENPQQRSRLGSTRAGVIKDYERNMTEIRAKTTKNQAVMGKLMFFCFEFENRFA
jgi:hypothetical protein